MTDSLTFSEVRFSEIRYEVMPLIEDHIRETEPYEPNMDFEMYDCLEEGGYYRAYVGRSDQDELAGYVSYFVNPAFHWRHRIIAFADGFYLQPEYRKGWNAVKMLRFAERSLKGLGVHDIFYAVKDNNAPRVLEALGYGITDVVYGKRIGD